MWRESTYAESEITLQYLVNISVSKRFIKDRLLDYKMGSCLSTHQEDVVQLLGEGSFGRVWKIRNPDKDERRENPFTALKVIKAPDSSAQDEVELMKTMEHRHIIKFINK